MRNTLAGLLAAFFGCSLFVNAIDAQPPGRDFSKRGQGNERPGRPIEKYFEGDVAPDFTLKSLDGKKSVTLSSFRGKQPVVLVFGSYT